MMAQIKANIIFKMKTSRAKVLNFILVFEKFMKISWEIFIFQSIKVHSRQTYLNYFSTDFDKRCLKLNLIQLSKTSQARFLNFVLVFEKFTKMSLEMSISQSVRGALTKKLSPSFLNQF